MRLYKILVNTRQVLFKIFYQLKAHIIKQSRQGKFLTSSSWPGTHWPLREQYKHF